MTLHLTHRYGINQEQSLLPNNVTFSRESAISKTPGSFKGAPRTVEVLTQQKTPRSAKMRAQSRARSADTTPRGLSPREITTFASGILEITHSLKELHSMHKDPELVKGFLINKHIDDPRYSKMQRAFNSLQDRVTLYDSSDSRIQNLFSLMIQKVVSNLDSEVIPTEMEKTIDEMIGMENIVSSGPFKQFGVICVRDAAIPDPRPENVVSVSELKEMKMLREKLRMLPLFNKVKIEGTEQFRQRIFDDFNKMLCFSEGREIITALYRLTRPTVIREGDESLASFSDPSKWEVHIDNSKSMSITTSGIKDYSVQHPAWTTLPHELIHVLHASKGFQEEKAVAHLEDERWTEAEEYVTIGDPDHPPRISENGILRHTTHPLRNYHSGGIDTDFPLPMRIYLASESGLAGDIERILIENPDMGVKELKQIGYSKVVKESSELQMKLLNHPRKEEFIDSSFIHDLLLSSLENDKEEIVEKILTENMHLVRDIEQEDLIDLILEAAEKGSGTSDAILGIISKNFPESFPLSLYISTLNTAIKLDDEDTIKLLKTIHSYYNF